MSSKNLYTTNSIIQYPGCGKSMLLKNWKTHGLQMHSMSQSAIDAKYIELKREVEQSKSKVISVTSTTNIEKPSPLVTNTLFSMKRFALSKSTSLDVAVSDVNIEENQTQSIESSTEDTVLNSAISNVEAVSTNSTSACAQMDINEECTLHRFLFIA